MADISKLKEECELAMMNCFSTRKVGVAEFAFPPQLVREDQYRLHYSSSSFANTPGKKKALVQTKIASDPGPNGDKAGAPKPGRKRNTVKQRKGGTSSHIKNVVVWEIVVELQNPRIVTCGIGSLCYLR